MEKRFVIGIDEGTTSERVVLFDTQKNAIVDSDQQSIGVKYPKSGWVEQDANEIAQKIWSSVINILKKNKLKNEQIVGIGITNQRETVVAWGKDGKAVCPAIVWQCRRTAEFCESIPMEDKEWIRKKTGLIMDAYFSASKMKWMLEHESKVKTLATKGELHFGTIDSFLAYVLTCGRSFVTDTTNASRTMLVDLKSLKNGKYDFDDSLLKYFGIERKFLPKIVNSAENVGEFQFEGYNIPILSMIGDQQASLVGQGCVKEGQAKNTYGTGCFFMQNVGDDIEKSLKANKLLTTVAYSIDGETNYALEGSVFHAGSMVAWLKDELKVINNVLDIEPMCLSVEDNAGVYLLPAFTGIGAPYWNGFLRGAFVGLTLGTKKEHLVRACMESITYLSRDIIEYASQKGFDVKKMVCDGGVSKNGFVMQFQSDMLNQKIYKSVQGESTVIGAIYLSMICAKMLKENDIPKLIAEPKEYAPQMTKKEREKYICGWQEMIKKQM